MKSPLKNRQVRTTVCFALALIFMCTAQTVMAQSSMRGFAGGGSASSATEKIIPAPQTSGKWQLKYDDPGINVTLKNWNCRNESMWKLVTNILDGYRAMFGTNENAVQGNETAQVNPGDYSNLSQEGIKRSPRDGVFNPYFGSTITETHRFCYTDAEVEQFRAYLQGLSNYLSKQTYPIKEINRMFPK